jgi:hypothetical protein
VLLQLGGILPTVENAWKLLGNLAWVFRPNSGKPPQKCEIDDFTLSLETNAPCKNLLS